MLQQKKNHASYFPVYVLLAILSCFQRLKCFVLFCFFSVPGLGRAPGVGNGNPLQYYCLENRRQRTLVGYSPWGRRVRYDWVTEHVQAHTHTRTHTRAHTLAHTQSWFTMLYVSFRCTLKWFSFTCKCIYFFRFFFLISNCKILSIVPCVIQ